MFLSLKDRLEKRLAGLPVPELVTITAKKRQKQGFGVGHIPPKKFDEQTALTIRSLYNPPETSYRTLATEFGTCKATIEHIVRGKGAYKALPNSSCIGIRNSELIPNSELLIPNSNASINFTTNW
jgi:hypothetical protein